ncbi:MAG TPA: DUF883 C-terminal domain-containing protein [Pyrinomonadaceae bacterium]|jgi:ElaB/YqjD/DUF883 family membrane-anchored ribosome-binding protein|nr:DUF883 C-terminal domain-containing protein [Pyrinomonadaceae bacterium]
MSQNRPGGGTPDAGGAGGGSTSGTGGTGNSGNTGYGGAGTGATDAGTTRDTSTSLTTGAGATGGGATGGGAATGAATGIAAQAKEYGQKVAEAATTAKDYLSDKASVVGDKFTDLRNKDYGQMAEEAKEYARQKPGQALLISAAAGFVIGLLLRGSRRR